MFTSQKNTFSIVPIIKVFIVSIIIFTLFRAGLTLWKFADCQENLSEIFIYGLRYDVSINCSMMAPILLITLIAHYFIKTSEVFIFFQKLYLTLVLTVQFFVELTTIPFIFEYGVRPNNLYVEYLIYPKEVFSMILNGHLLEGIICVLLTVIALVFFYRAVRHFFKNNIAPSRKINTAVLILSLILVPLGIRGTVSHKPLNTSNASFSNIPLVNSIPPNSSFTVFYALRHMNDYKVSASAIYSFDTKENVIKNLSTISRTQKPLNPDGECPINQIITPSVTGEGKKNVVVILEESLGARYVKSLGGDDICPQLDSLKNEGWWFEKMYATGHRSVRGIEAVTASYPPCPLTSQVRLNHSETMTTISSIYQALGYKTSFIYGGESHFDNMRNYFFNNGVDEIIEQKDYENPEFTTTWGVSDEDLFKKANSYFKELASKNTPFCSVVFTSSFHDPFDIPKNKVNIDGINTNDPRRLTAAKYADYALGKFFEQAKKEEYYKNTVFLVIADHDSRVYGGDDFPFRNFSIPALIIGPGITPRTDDRIVNQIDMLPTLLSLTGVSGQFPIVGQDLTKDNIIERSMLIFYDSFGVYKDGILTILDPKSFQRYKVDDKNQIEPISNPAPVSAEEISYLNAGIQIYENHLNKYSCVKDLKQQ